VKRRTVLALAVMGVSALGLVAPALADDSSQKDPFKVCVQFPGHNPTSPQAPGYCLYVPNPTVPSH
jgi:hypothetical protein